MVIHRYSRWDGTQERELSTQDMMDQLSEQILEGDDLRGALRRMMERGGKLPNGERGMGMRDMLERLRQRRERNLEQYNLNNMMGDIQERLDEIIDTERQGIDKRLGDLDPLGVRSENGDGQEGGDQQGDAPGQGTGAGQESSAPGGDLADLLRSMAQRHTDQLDKLPDDVGGRIKELREYDFMDPEAREKFEELLQLLQKQVLENYFQGMQQSLQNMTQEDLKQTQEMIQDLNRLMEQKLMGDDPDITEFMQKWGQYFPPGIENFDQLLDYMQKMMGQMQSLMNSMSPEQRSELQDMMEALLQDDRLQWDMFQLASNMNRLDPDRFEDNRFSLTGDEPLSLQDALRLMGDLNSMEEMEDELRHAIRTNDPSYIDSDEVGRLLGEEAQQYAEELKRLTRELEEAGFLKRGDHGWELTAGAMRKIGEKALNDIFSRIRGQDLGDHNRDKNGIGVELQDETKPWVWGDPFHLNTQKTVANAVIRQGKGTPVRIKVEDFEINQTIAQARVSTVIAIDMSYSMMWSGYFQAGQRVGLALDTLIRSKYPKDQVTVLAFSYFVLPLESNMLLDTHWVEYGGGTNFQEVLRRSREILRRQGGTSKQIVLITDGEPTTYNYSAASEMSGNEWNPEDIEPIDVMAADPYEMLFRRRRRRGQGMIAETLREVGRCTRDNITINTFMLDRSPELLEFVKLMSKVNHGRAFVAEPDKLGTYVVADYFSNRNKVIR